jgi:hypothetical protein
LFAVAAIFVLALLAAFAVSASSFASQSDLSIVVRAPASSILSIVILSFAISRKWSVVVLVHGWIGRLRRYFCCGEVASGWWM